MQTTALLIDDHPLFRAGVAGLLGVEFAAWKVLQAGSLGEALERLDQHPDVSLVLLELGLPDSEGVASLVRLRLHAPGPRYVVLTSSDSEATMLSAIENGAAGFIPKTTPSTAMLAALRTVLAGGVFVPSNQAEALAAAFAPASAPACDVLGITPRQVDVLRLLIEGLGNKAICRALGISESTVKTHLVTIFRKLGATSRTQAVVAAARLGLRLRALPEPS